MNNDILLSSVRPVGLDEMKFPIKPSPLDGNDYTLDMFLGNTGSDIIPDNYEGIEPEIYNQYNTMMCLSFALAGITNIKEFKERGVRQKFSAAFIYVLRERSKLLHEGMIARFALADFCKYGICEHDKFPEIGSVEELKPLFESRKSYLIPDAMPQVISSYVRLNSVQDIQRAIMTNGAALCSYMIYPGFGTVKKDGIIEQVKPDDKTYGGHAMYYTGWKTINGKVYFKTANSWGTNWAANGVCYIPSDYLGFIEAWAIIDAKPLPNVSRKIYLTIGSDQMTIIDSDGNINHITMDVSANSQNGRMMVPIALVAKALGDKTSINWDNISRTAEITIRTYT